MAKKQKKNKKWISWLFILILFVVATAIVYLVWNAYFRDKKDDERDNKIQKSEQVEVAKKDDDKNDDNKIKEPEEVEEKPKTIQYEGEDPNTLEELSGVVTYAGVTANKLMIRVNIDQYLEDGVCKLSLMRDGIVAYSDMVGIVGNVATSTCEGFDISVDEAGEGEMEIKIELESGDKRGVIYGGVNI